MFALAQTLAKSEQGTFIGKHIESLYFLHTYILRNVALSVCVM